MELQTDIIVGRETSPDKLWVALVNHRVQIDNFLFGTSITDEVYLVKASDEEQFRRNLPQNYDPTQCAVIRYSRANRVEDRPLIRWLSADQLDITAPRNAHGSYIILSPHIIDNVTIRFSFNEINKAIKHQ
jgi:hypothetical protein